MGFQSESVDVNLHLLSFCPCHQAGRESLFMSVLSLCGNEIKALLPEQETATANANGNLIMLMIVILITMQFDIWCDRPPPLLRIANCVN